MAPALLVILLVVALPILYAFVQSFYNYRWNVPNFPVSEDQLTALVVILVGYIFGTAVEDGLTSGRPSIPDNKGPTQ